MILAIPAALVLVVLFLVWRRARRNRLPVGPLAGYDTGVRSSYRSPARFFNNRRTL